MAYGVARQGRALRLLAEMKGADHHLDMSILKLHRHRDSPDIDFNDLPTTADKIMRLLDEAEHELRAARYAEKLEVERHSITREKLIGAKKELSRLKRSIPQSL